MIFAPWKRSIRQDFQTQSEGSWESMEGSIDQHESCLQRSRFVFFWSVDFVDFYRGGKNILSACGHKKLPAVAILEGMNRFPKTDGFSHTFLIFSLWG